MSLFWLESAKGNSFAFVRPATATIDKRLMESVHIVMLSVYHEALTHSHIAIVERVHVKSNKKQITILKEKGKLRTLIRQAEVEPSVS